jgi:hypothetical protein
MKSESRWQVESSKGRYQTEIRFCMINPCSGGKMPGEAVQSCESSDNICERETRRAIKSGPQHAREPNARKSRSADDIN